LVAAAVEPWLLADAVDVVACSSPAVEVWSMVAVDWSPVDVDSSSSSQVSVTVITGTLLVTWIVVVGTVNVVVELFLTVGGDGLLEIVTVVRCGLGVTEVVVLRVVVVVVPMTVLTIDDVEVRVEVLVTT